MTANTFLPSFFFAALQISAAQAMQTAAATIYAHGTEEQKRNAGVFDDTIRISVGIENIEDLKSDFKQAVDSINVNESEE